MKTIALLNLDGTPSAHEIEIVREGDLSVLWINHRSGGGELVGKIPTSFLRLGMGFKSLSGDLQMAPNGGFYEIRHRGVYGARAWKVGLDDLHKILPVDGD